MSTVAFIRKMLELGFSHDDALRAAEAHEAVSSVVKVRSAGAERQSRYAERQRQKASESVSNDENDASDDVSTLSRPLPPQTPPTPTHTRDGITTHARAADPVEPERPPPRRTAKRLPDGWTPSQADLDYAASQFLTPDEARRVSEDFRDYWTAKGGEAGRKLDWPATWRTWVRRHIDRRPSPRMASRPAFNGGGGQGPSDFASIVAERRSRDRDADDVPRPGETISGAFRVVG